MKIASVQALYQSDSQHALVKDSKDKIKSEEISPQTDPYIYAMAVAMYMSESYMRIQWKHNGIQRSECKVEQ